MALFTIIKGMFSTYETYLKISVIVVYSIFIWHCHTIYDNSKETIAVKQELKAVNKGQNEIIKFNQQLRESDANKDPCFNTRHPASVSRLLK